MALRYNYSDILHFCTAKASTAREWKEEEKKRKKEKEGKPRENYRASIASNLTTDLENSIFLLPISGCEVTLIVSVGNRSIQIKRSSFSLHEKKKKKAKMADWIHRPSYNFFYLFFFHRLTRWPLFLLDYIFVLIKTSMHTMHTEMRIKNLFILLFSFLFSFGSRKYSRRKNKRSLNP